MTEFFITEAWKSEPATGQPNRGVWVYVVQGPGGIGWRKFRYYEDALRYRDAENRRAS